MSTPNHLASQTKEAVEACIDALFEDRITASKAMHATYGLLWEHIQEVALGGKRIRPQLVMVGHGSFSEAIVPIAAAQELLHVAMLIHDDVIDRDEVRHGRPNLNGLYRQRYQPYATHESLTHHAYGASLLAGDLLLSEAYRLVADSVVEADTIQKLQARLHHSIFEVVGGELLDVEAPLMRDVSVDPLVIARYKTAGYSFIGPLVTGALCRQASPHELEVLEAYGEAAGIAFQVQDDILGVFGDESVTGKSTLSDLREAKATYLIDRHLALISDEQRRHFMQSFGNTGASDVTLEAMKEAIEASGAREATEAICREYYLTALQTLERLEDGTQRHWLASFTRQLMDRVV